MIRFSTSPTAYAALHYVAKAMKHRRPSKGNIINSAGIYSRVGKAGHNPVATQSTVTRYFIENIITEIKALRHYSSPLAGDLGVIKARGESKDSSDE